jgi:nucleoside-diphosphate-sugar epimerase
VLDLKPITNFDGRFKACDIRDRASLADEVQGFDVIINTAIIQLPRINEDKQFGYEVNVLGILNLLEAVESTNSVKGLVHASSWHVFGERDFRGKLDEEFGFRPDKVEARARFYALCKIAQETLIRLASEMSRKSYSIIRLGTVLGEDMPKQTAACIFIENALRGEPMTPFRHTKNRPMLYVDILDVCKAFEVSVSRILNCESPNPEGNPTVVNLVSPPPITVLEMAQMVQLKVRKLTKAKISPQINIIDGGKQPLHTPKDKTLFKVDISKAREMLGLRSLTSPQQSIERIISKKIGATT